MFERDSDRTFGVQTDANDGTGTIVSVSDSEFSPSNPGHSRRTRFGRSSMLGFDEVGIWQSARCEI